jgi:Tol biopolymer transport system component
MKARTKSISLWSFLGGAAVFGSLIALSGNRAETQTTTAPPPVKLVSFRQVGGQGDNNSSGAVASSGGRCVAFYSDATNLVPHDNNRVRDVFVHDDEDGTIQRVSLASDGSEANGPSQAEGLLPAIDEACTCVAFTSDATNLVTDDTNRRTDVFVRDLRADPPTTLRASVGDGTEANGASFFPSLSADCQLVAFQSTASNLVPDDTNGVSDIFVYNRATGLTTRVSVAADGTEGNGFSVTPAMSADGRCVAFATKATNLWPDDTNNARDILVACDGVITCLASVDSNGVQGDGDSFLPAISADGRIVAFKSAAANLVPDDTNGVVDVFVHDCETGETSRVSVGTDGAQGNGLSFPPGMSGDGRFVAFGSAATSIVRGVRVERSQVYVHDRQNGTTTLLTASPSGQPGNGSVPDLAPGVSIDGRAVAFASAADNLVPGDINGFADVFISQLEPRPTSTPTVPPTVPPTPTRTPTEMIPCFVDRDCPLGQICIDRTCRIIECQNDDDCPGDRICVENRCRPAPVTPIPLPTCTTDEDCRFDCENSDDCPVPSQMCVGNECSPEARCRAEVCVPPRPCDPETPETWPLECRGERETCLDGICECGGDCDLNGIVFGTEISRIVCILGEVCDLSACVTADINGDGLVTGTDVSLAVRNLGLGCPGEGTPLLFPRDRTDETRIVELPDIEGIPGQFLTVEVGIGGGDEVTTAQVDVLYEEALLELTDPVSGAPRCQIADRLAAAFRAEIQFPQVPLTPPGIRRLRLAVVDEEPPFPLDSYGPGPLFTCTFRISPQAVPGTESSLMPVLSRLEIGDPFASQFHAEVTGGAIRVLEAIPCMTDEDCPPGTQCLGGFCRPIIECDTFDDCADRQSCVENRCACAGDCNGDGEVFANEVATSIAIFGGTQSVDLCPAADINGDGEVFANEVATSITNFALGCP